RVDAEAHAAESLRAFDAVEALGLLCLPGYTQHDTLTAALAYCERRRVFLVVDGAGFDPAAPRRLAAALRATASASAAVYFPSVTIADPIAGGTARSVPPSGSVAGVMARTDTMGVWTFPMGQHASIHGAIGIGAILDDRAAHELQVARVNVI